MLATLGVQANDSTTSNINPSMNLQTVTPGSGCANVGLIAQTSTGNVASCQLGRWVSRSLSNPEVVVSNNSVVSGFGGMAVFAACPVNKVAVSGGCIMFPITVSNDPASFNFIIDQITVEGGVTGFQMPIAGDTGIYCLAVADTGNSATIAATAICVDR